MESSDSYTVVWFVRRIINTECLSWSKRNKTIYRKMLLIRAHIHLNTLLFPFSKFLSSTGWTALPSWVRWWGEAAATRCYVGERTKHALRRADPSGNGEGLLVLSVPFYGFSSLRLSFSSLICFNFLPVHLWLTVRTHKLTYRSGPCHLPRRPFGMKGWLPSC